MLEHLATFDLALFLFVNVQLANPLTDALMPVITSDWLLRVLYGVALLVMLWKGDKKMRWLVLVSACTLAATDQLSAGLLKPLIDRPRPCHTLPDIHLLIGCGGGMAMPSSHAANAFGQAVLFSTQYRMIRWYLLTIATAVASSRVFVGVHYPGDVLAGMVLGGLLGFGLARLFMKIERRWM